MLRGSPITPHLQLPLHHPQLVTVLEFGQTLLDQSKEEGNEEEKDDDKDGKDKVMDKDDMDKNDQDNKKKIRHGQGQ